MYTQWGDLSQGRKMNAVQEKHKIKPDLSTLDIQFKTARFNIQCSAAFLLLLLQASQS